MNKRAQGIGPVSTLFAFIFVIVILGMAGGQIFGLWDVAKPDFITDMPVENFLMSNPAFFVIFALCLGAIGYYYFGGSR